MTTGTALSQTEHAKLTTPAWKIPPQWKEGSLKRLYKGKGVKGKCSNERGITLASNVGKPFERLVNNRLLYVLEKQRIINPY